MIRRQGKRLFSCLDLPFFTTFEPGLRIHGHPPSPRQWIPCVLGMRVEDVYVHLILDRKYARIMATVLALTSSWDLHLHVACPFASLTEIAVPVARTSDTARRHQARR